MHHPRDGFQYDRVKFSHDCLPLEQMTSVVTEEDVLTIAQTKTLFNELLEEHEEQVKDFNVPVLKRKTPKHRMRNEDA